jgi:hypothetical protein
MPSVAGVNVAAIASGDAATRAMINATTRPVAPSVGSLTLDWATIRARYLPKALATTIDPALATQQAPVALQ